MKNAQSEEINHSSRKSSLYVVFKCVAIGSGIIGIGFAIAIIGILLTSG
jgi:preprotein translocase subunit Sss1